ncbi:DUF4235 domain-containing protein [uncultured Jatrophihabitans sp.]|uniref:DUF4235 domain-containing protein n=1 Tax=uncultured Jatrophihabitans sp. TaxID=1610747 RepID=UPI0035CB90CF
MAAGAKIGIKVISIVIGIPVGIATRKIVEKAWETARPEAPPRKPTDADVHWSDAVAWGALSAVGIVVADLLTRRSAEAAYSAITGNAAPPPKPSKGSKKLQQAAEKSPATNE